MKRTKFGHIKPICLRNRQRGWKNLQNFMRRYSKQDFTERTLFDSARWLARQYNINAEQALAHIAYVAKQSKINGNGKVSGQMNTYGYKAFSDIVDRYGYHLSQDFINRINEMHYKTKDMQSPDQRFKVLSLELLAYLQARKSLPPKEALAQRIANAEWRAGGSLVANVWSKPQFWVTANILVFDVLSQSVPTANAMEFTLSEDGSTLTINPRKWYDTRQYMTGKERFMWKVFDEVAEEVARELVAAALAQKALVYTTRSLRLLADIVFTLAKFHPNIRIYTTITDIARAIATYLEGSFLAWLGTQVAIEWNLEAWLASFEWKILKSIRDFFSGYNPPEDVFSKQELEEFKELANKYLTNPEMLTQADLSRLHYLYSQAVANNQEDMIKWYEHMINERKRIEWYNEMKKLQKQVHDAYMDGYELPPDLRDRTTNPERREQDMEDLINDERKDINEESNQEENFNNPFNPEAPPGFQKRYESRRKGITKEGRIWARIHLFNQTELLYEDTMPDGTITCQSMHTNKWGTNYREFTPTNILNNKPFISIPNGIIVTISKNCTVPINISNYTEETDNYRVEYSKTTNIMKSEIPHEAYLVDIYKYPVCNHDFHGPKPKFNATYTRIISTTKTYFKAFPTYLILPIRFPIFDPFLFYKQGKKCIGFKKIGERTVKKAIHLPSLAGSGASYSYTATNNKGGSVVVSVFTTFSRKHIREDEYEVTYQQTKSGNEHSAGQYTVVEILSGLPDFLIIKNHFYIYKEYGSDGASNYFYALIRKGEVLQKKYTQSRGGSFISNGVAVTETFVLSFDQSKSIPQIELPEIDVQKVCPRRRRAKIICF